jgi:hypothetical protein
MTGWVTIRFSIRTLLYRVSKSGSGKGYWFRALILLMPHTHTASDLPSEAGATSSFEAAVSRDSVSPVVKLNIFGKWTYSVTILVHSLNFDYFQKTKEQKICYHFFTASVRNTFRSDEYYEYLARGAETAAGLRVVSDVVFQSLTELECADTFR